MRYLLYMKDGLVRKFPLPREPVVIGRGRASGLRLTDAKVSKAHCRLELTPDGLRLTDLQSRNGTLVKGRRISQAVLALNESFGIGGTEFFYRAGDPGDFAVSPELSDLISLYSRRKHQSRETEPETMEAEPPFARLLLVITNLVFTCRGPADFFAGLAEILAPGQGEAALVCQAGDESTVITDPRGLAPAAAPLLEEPEPASAGNWSRGFVSLHYHCFRSPHLHGCRLWRLQPAGSGPGELSPERVDFYRKLAELIDVQLRLAPSLSFDPQPVPVLVETPELTIIGQSASLRETVALARKIAPRSSFVLILGESGTGKELIARFLHQLSGRRPFIALNCSAIPANLLESELFGYESGAFTGARRRKTGKIEEASGGTLVLDEIGELPLEIQAKLLRVIQERSLTRLGGHETIPVDLRIIAMTNRDLYRLVEEGKFRSDLFYRLRVHEITVPPLRERPEDIPPLIMHFTRLHARRLALQPGGFSRPAHTCLMAYSWPGNIRELENEIARIMELIDDGELIGDHHILPAIRTRCPAAAEKPEPATPGTYQERRQAAEAAEVENLLRECGGNKSAAARQLGMSYRGFLKKLRRLGWNERP